MCNIVALVQPATTFLQPLSLVLITQNLAFNLHIGLRCCCGDIEQPTLLSLSRVTSSGPKASSLRPKVGIRCLGIVPLQPGTSQGTTRCMNTRRRPEQLRKCLINDSLRHPSDGHECLQRNG
eukprot:Gb_14289 [translate_table: standard]